LGGMAGCAASPEPTSLGRNSLLTGKLTGKLRVSGRYSGF
jgi:hypothetical protein